MVTDITPKAKCGDEHERKSNNPKWFLIHHWHYIKSVGISYCCGCDA